MRPNRFRMAAARRGHSGTNISLIATNITVVVVPRYNVVVFPSRTCAKKRNPTAGTVRCVRRRTDSYPVGPKTRRDTCVYDTTTTTTTKKLKNN